METEFQETIAPRRWMWCIINNLQQFDSKPEYLLEMLKKFKRIKNVLLFLMFLPCV